MPPLGVHVFFLSCVTLPSWSRGFDPAPRHCSLVLVPATIKHLWNLPFPDWQCQGISTLHSSVRMLFCCHFGIARAPARCRHVSPAGWRRHLEMPRKSMPAAWTQSAGGLRVLAADAPKRGERRRIHLRSDNFSTSVLRKNLLSF